MKFELAKNFKIMILFTCSIFIFTGGCKIENTSLKCPIASLNETKEDCPWAAITRLCRAEASEYTIKNILNSQSPGLLKAIIRDAQKNNLKNVWGKSINYDEGEKEIIVKPLILDTLLKLAKVSPPIASTEHNGKKIIVHAGIIHTYGYLFSNLQTAYGYKRARWVKDDIETGFELPGGILGPLPTSGTLFTNITYFISHIAFQAEPKILSELNESDVPVVLRHFDYRTLKIRRLIEIVKLNPDRIITLRTDLVEFKIKQGGRQNDNLLVYSFLDSSEKTPMLITCFPVSSDFAKGLFKASRLGENKLIKTRYNAFISGFTDSYKPHRGLRKAL